MITPVGPLPPQVYWRRRALVIVLAVVVLIGLVWFVVSRASKGPSSPSPVAASATTSSDSPLTGVLASPSSSPSTVDRSSAGSAGSSSASSSAASSAATSAASSAPTTSAARSSGSARPTTTASSAPASSSAANAPLPRRTSTPTPQATITPSRTTAAKPPASATGAAPTTSKAPATTAKPSATPTPTPTSTAPSRDAQGRLLCTRSALTLTTTTGAPSYASGAKPILGLTVTNSGKATCTQDVSGSRQVFTVTTPAGRRIWSTSDCFPGTGTDVRTLEPGESLQYNIKWSGTSSQPGCTGTRSVVGPGTYQVTASLGSWAATPATLVLTG